MSGQEFGNREIFIDTAEERTGGGGGAGGAGFSGGERPQRSECLCYCVWNACFFSMVPLLPCLYMAVICCSCTYVVAQVRARGLFVLGLKLKTFLYFVSSKMKLLPLL